MPVGKQASHRSPNRLQMRIWEAGFDIVPGKALPGGKARRRVVEEEVLRPVCPVAMRKIAFENWPAVILESFPRRLGRS